ncbi:MAG: hypothetical protein LUH21_04215 [Clostridiales bacterium]|nr:hypothetical protein [Clostridiales bacterium]
MKIKTWIKYEESYLPTSRSKKLRYKECEDYILADLEEVNMSKLKLAFEDNSFEGKGKIYFYNNKLWCKASRNLYIAKNYGTKSALEDLIWISKNCSTYFSFDFDRIQYGKDTSREHTIKSITKDMNARLLVDGELFNEISEPRYIIMSFGSGSDYSVGMFVEYGDFHNYNNNCFSALDDKKAIEYANIIAEGTNDFGKFKKLIVVHMPELVGKTL